MSLIMKKISMYNYMFRPGLYIYRERLSNPQSIPLCMKGRECVEMCNSIRAVRIHHMTVRLIDVLTLRGICNQQNLSLSMQQLSSAWQVLFYKLQNPRTSSGIHHSYQTIDLQMSFRNLHTNKIWFRYILIYRSMTFWVDSCEIWQFKRVLCFGESIINFDFVLCRQYHGGTERAPWHNMIPYLGKGY